MKKIKVFYQMSDTEMKNVIGGSKSPKVVCPPDEANVRPEDMPAGCYYYGNAVGPHIEACRWKAVGASCHYNGLITEDGFTKTGRVDGNCFYWVDGGGNGGLECL